MVKLDAKFYGQIRKVKDDTTVPDDEYVVFLAKDTAFASILPVYYYQCIRLGCDAEQIEAVELMIKRLELWRAENPDKVYIANGQDPEHGEGVGHLYAIDASKIRRELGWKPRQLFNDGLLATVKWYLDHRNWCEQVQAGQYNRERLGLQT